MTRTEAALVAAARPLRRSLAWLGVAGSVAGLALVLALAALALRAGWLHSPLWVPGAWGLGILSGALAAGLAARHAAGLRVFPLAARLEREGGWRRGAIRALLEPAGMGTSTELLSAADAAAAQDLQARADDALGEERRMLARRLLVAVATTLGCAGLIGAAGVRRGPAALLWDPAHALAMATSPLRLEADRLSVKAGDSVSLLVIAPGRRSVTLWTRSPGTTWAPASIALDSMGRARRSTGPLAEAMFA
ncbi:MAG TPA: hypothetical protein VF187_08595, partial [Gemmatimonadales bacterium]